ncbi:MAG TPA: hypothetical protein VHJ19_07395 [Gammaproteobacteria bacterium]|nr:hypothetical protein [Gammaproteobacteria bacterium]
MAKCEVYGNACHLSFCRWAICARRQGCNRLSTTPKRLPDRWKELVIC